MNEDRDDQLALVAMPRQRQRRASTVSAEGDAFDLPVARVAVDIPLSHLDRLFDYRVPASLDHAARSGCRVKVRFGGKLVDGFLVERVERSEHDGPLGVLAKVVSDESVLRADVYQAARKVADRYAGTLADVLRLAIPPRHARTEKLTSAPATTAPLPDVDPCRWSRYRGGSDFLAALHAGDSPRVCWSAVPDADPARAIAEAVLATLRSGRGAIVCLPDLRDVDRFDAVFSEVLGNDRHVVLTASQGPADRYRAFLALSRGTVRVVIGTRAAAFAPVHDVGLVAIFDDGDDLFSELRAPYPHAREVLLTRGHDGDTAVLIGGFARSCEAQLLVDSLWCVEVTASQSDRRSAWPRVSVTDGSAEGAARARLPRDVFTLMRAALRSGPVLMQVPRKGYRTSLACQECRVSARCAHCAGPLIQPAAHHPLRCAWCADAPARWACAECGSHRLRAPVVGQLRTAEEVAQAFDGVPVLTSSGDLMVDSIGPEAAIVLATPGAEPRAEGGYSAAVLLDTWLQLTRADLRVDEEAHRRWFNALALVRPSADGGQALAVGDPTGLQALVRADPVGFAQRELLQRSRTHLPPATRVATIEGDLAALRQCEQAEWPRPAEVLGPVAIDDERGRIIIRVPRHKGGQLARMLVTLQAQRSSAKAGTLRVQVDPLVL